MPFFVKPIVKGMAGKVRSAFIKPQLKLHLDFMEGELGKSEWFAGGELTAADVQMSFPLEAAVARGSLDARYPALNGWLARIHARPAYRKALELGGPYDMGG